MKTEKNMKEAEKKRGSGGRFMSSRRLMMT